MIQLKVETLKLSEDTANNYGEFVVSFFKKTASREIKGFNKDLNLLKNLDIESEILDIGWQVLWSRKMDQKMY